MPGLAIIQSYDAQHWLLGHRQDILDQLPLVKEHCDRVVTSKKNH